jgi:hypothetical protein
MVQLYPEKMSFHIGLAADGLYTMNDNLEGMKYSIGGSGYRLLPFSGCVTPWECAILSAVQTSAS